jgi:tetratricopeptide (TPR) repeat protein
VLEGSVQRSENRMRVNVQLVETDTGAHLWAERFDKPVADHFDMQDEIVSRLANRLGQELAAAEARRAARSANPDSMDHYFLGMAFLNKGITAELLDKARSHFDRALDLDLDNIDALIGRARVDVASVANWLSEDRVKRVRSAEADLGKALRLRPENANARTLLGMVRMFSNRALQGIAECERALAIDPKPPLTGWSVWASILSDATRRPRRTSSKRCASARATLAQGAGWAPSGSPNFTRAVTKKRSHG